MKIKNVLKEQEFAVPWGVVTDTATLGISMQFFPYKWGAKDVTVTDLWRSAPYVSQKLQRF
jgi:hypothetical protein